MNTPDRRAVVKALCDEAVWLYCARKHFSDLFETGAKRRALLEEVAGLFFHDLNTILLEHVLLQICRLTDPASSGKNKDNLSTNYVLSLNWSSSTRAVLEAANARLMTFRTKVIDARRQLIAHLDLRTRLQEIGLGSFTEEDEQAFWEALEDFVHAASNEALDDAYDFKVAMQDGDVTSLIHFLRDGVDYDDAVREDASFLMRRLHKRRHHDA